MRFDNPFCEGCCFQSTCRIYPIFEMHPISDLNFQLQKEFLIYLLSVPNDSRPHFCNSWDKILIFSLELEFYQKQLVPSLIPTIRSSYARQMKKLSKFRNLFCIVPLYIHIKFRAPAFKRCHQDRNSVTNIMLSST